MIGGSLHGRINSTIQLSTKKMIVLKEGVDGQLSLETFKQVDLELLITTSDNLIQVIFQYNKW